MKFLTFNIVVLGALFFLYHFGGAGAATAPEPASEPTRQVESGSQERAVVHALSDRVAVLAQTVARLESHLSEVLQRDEANASERPTAASTARVEPAPEPISHARSTSAEATPRKPRPEAPKRPAAAPTTTASSDLASRASAAEPKPAKPVAPAEIGGSEFSTNPEVAARDMGRRSTGSAKYKGSEWSDGGATVTAEDLAAGTDAHAVSSAGSDAPLIEGDLMTPSQRRNALLQLAQDMELHYLASSGE